MAGQTFKAPSRLHVDDGREEPPPAQAGVHRRGQGRRPVQRRVEDARARSRPSRGARSSPATTKKDEPTGRSPEACGKLHGEPASRQRRRRSSRQRRRACGAAMRCMPSTLAVAARSLCLRRAVAAALDADALTPSSRLATRRQRRTVERDRSARRGGRRPARAAVLAGAARRRRAGRAGEQVLIVEGRQGASTRSPAPSVPLPADAEDVVDQQPHARASSTARSPRCELFSPDVGVRLRRGARSCRTAPTTSQLPLIEKALAQRDRRRAQARSSTLTRGVARARRAPTRRRGSPPSQALADSDQSRRARRCCWTAASNGDESSSPTTTCAPQLQKSLRGVEARLALGRARSASSSPASASARILLLAALGLAITFGLMGVINMAHGELMMIGAYATYVVQNLFRSYLPGAFDCVPAGRRPGRVPGLRRWSAWCSSAA